jgi:hypothetical protein
MFKSKENITNALAKYKIYGNMFCYGSFVPRLYNFCKSIGFEAGKIMPSRAFCSDESQGYPIILIAKHFQTFPFNHGRAGGVFATDRLGPHAEHGKDMVIIQAGHVGYDPELKTFGSYRRLCTEHSNMTASCGKIDIVLSWYINEYNFLKNNIFIEKRNNNYYIIIDNQLLNASREEGLFLDLDKLLAKNGKYFIVEDTYSTSVCYLLKADIADYFSGITNKETIGEGLAADYFYFKKSSPTDVEGKTHLENNLIETMPWIVAAKFPLLEAAKINSQVEFDRAYRAIIKSQFYKNKRVVYISGLNIDISPEEGEIFPLTKFIPWAAFVQDNDGKHRIIEQAELVSILNAQSHINPDQINLERAIQAMEEVQEVVVL